MPADTFVLIFKCVARPNICEAPALAKPPPRCRQWRDSERHIKNTPKMIGIDPFLKNFEHNFISMRIIEKFCGYLHRNLKKVQL